MASKMIMNIELWLIIACGTLLWTACPGQAAAAASDANSVESYLFEVRMLRSENKQDEAIAAIEKVLAIEPNNESVLNEGFQVFWYFQRWDDMLKVEDKLISLHPNDPNLLRMKFFHLAELNRCEETLKVSDKLIQLEPNEVCHYKAMAQCLESLKRYDEALAAIDKTTKMYPDMSDAWTLKGHLQCELKQYDAAIASATRAIEVTSYAEKGYGLLVYNRACIYAIKGDKTNALADLKLAIEKAPNFREQAKKDVNFKALQNDPDFKKLTE
jgi:tetratricopeptide (TPR) repeat protein